MDTIKWTVNKMPKTADANLKIMGLDEVRKARTFHESFPQYSVTPLAKLDHMAARLGLSRPGRMSQNFLTVYSHRKN